MHFRANFQMIELSTKDHVHPFSILLKGFFILFLNNLHHVF